MPTYCNFTENGGGGGGGCQPLEASGSYTCASNSWASCWILYIALPWLLCTRARVKRLPLAHASCIAENRTVLCGLTLVMIFILHFRPSVWLCWELQDDIASSKVHNCLMCSIWAELPSACVTWLSTNDLVLEKSMLLQ